MPLFLAFFVLLLLGSTAALADTSGPAPTVAATPAPPAANPESWTQFITLQGQLDAYFQFRYGTGAPRAPNQFRAFDPVNDSFQIALARLSVVTQTSPVGFRLDLAFGSTADLASFDGPSKLTSETYKMLEQAFVMFALPARITLDAGKFETWAGSEVIEARDNWNYSRSMLFLNGPFTHTGLRAQMQVTDALVLKLALVNGWEVVNDNNPQKSIGAAVAYTVPGANTSIAVTTYQGVEESTGALPGFNGGTALPWRQYYDLVVAQPLGRRWSLNLNAAAQWQFEPILKRWWGIAVGGQYVAGTWLRIAARYEFFQDTDGAETGLGSNTLLNSGTLTLAFPVGSNGEVRIEGRGDFSSRGFFGPLAKQSQWTSTAAALAWF